MSPLSKRTIATIGSGVMAEAMISILLRTELVSPGQITGSEPHENRRQELATKYGVRIISDNRQAVAGADVIMLTVKPQTLDMAMCDLAGGLEERQVVVSIVPGATIERLMTGLDHGSVVRSMPNTPAQIGSGVTVWIPSPAVDEAGRELVSAVLNAMGLAVRVDSEDAIDMATALSGTGPAYIFMVMEALIDAGVHMGFPR